MGKYTSYYLYQKYEKIGSQDWTPVYPQTLSVYSDGTESGSTVIKSDNDTACGYKPSTEVQYRWVRLNPSTDYICDNCELWVASGYICDNGDLYEQLNEQNFDGKNWYYTGVKKKGKLLEENSKNCTGDTGGTGGDTGSTTGDTTGGTGTDTGGTTGDTGTTTGSTTGSTIGSREMKVTYIDGSTKIFTGLTSIEKDTDANKKNAKEVVIGNGVTSIGDVAFSYCEYLTSVTIPNSVTSIGGGAFFETSWRLDITINSTTPPKLGFNAIPSSVFVIHVPAESVDTYKSAWSGYADKIVAIGTIPSMRVKYYTDGFDRITKTYYNLTSIEKDFDKDSYPKKKDAESVEIFNSVKSIGDNAFSGCKKLFDITIPNSVTSIGAGAFGWCENLCHNLTGLTIPNSVTRIGGRAFYDCKWIKSISIPDGVTRIYQETFTGCVSLTSITIPNSVTEIDSGAFEYCTGLTDITIPDSVKSIEWQTFAGCKALTSIIIGNGVTEIGEEAFEGCSNLKNIKIGNNVKTIGVNAFSGCTSFTDIILPSSVIQINAKAFYTCSSLKNITVKATTPPTLQSFNTLPGNIGLTIYVPASSLNAYKSNGSWKDYNIQAIP